LPPALARAISRWRAGAHDGSQKSSRRADLDVVKRNRELALRHNGISRCFVLGNGPSIREQDLLPLQHEVTFVCNFFNLHPQSAAIAPTYWCFDDANAFRPMTHGESLEIDREAWFADICQKSPSTEFILPITARPLVEASGWLSGRRIWYVSQMASATALGYANSDLTRPLAHGQGTLTALAIPAAIFMGFREIYLLGVDANWWVNNLAREDMDGQHAHFYDRNPFVPREPTLRDFGLERELRDLSLHFQSYRLLREHAASRGVKILNATRGGILDVFDRVDFERVLCPEQLP
jgi:hypothetical protein